MKRTTATLLTGVLAASGFIGLASIAPGMASAGGCGNTVITPTTLQGWNFTTDTRTAGSVEFAEAGGLDVKVTENSGQGKATGTYGNLNLPLADQTGQQYYTITTDKGQDAFVKGFSYQLQIDRDGNGTRDEYLVYEPADYGTGIWHTNTSGSRLGYRFTGDLDAYLTGLPAQGEPGAPGYLPPVEGTASARILAFGFTLGSGVPAAQTHVDQVRFGCSTFSFAADPVAPANQAPVSQFSVSAGTDPATTRDYAFDATASYDPDAPAGSSGITRYFWDFGNGGTQDLTTPTTTYTYPADTEPGEYTVTLTVSDGQLTNASTTKITITVPPRQDTGPLAATGVQVLGLTVLGGLAVAGASTGLVINRRRKTTGVV